MSLVKIIHCFSGQFLFSSSCFLAIITVSRTNFKDVNVPIKENPSFKKKGFAVFTSSLISQHVFMVPNYFWEELGFLEEKCIVSRH